MNKKITAFILLAAACVNLAGCASAVEETVAVTADTAPVATTVETVEETVAETSAEISEATEQTEEEPMPTADENGDFLSDYDEFELTSEDLIDGVWSDAIAGDNLSPSLSWDPVEGADSYVIYMVDTTAYYFLHWKADGVTDTQLPLGWAVSDYIGPYPPSGATHTYDVYVIAIRGSVDRVRGTVNTQNQNFPRFINQLDTDIDGMPGNIISYGRLSGVYTAD